MATEITMPKLSDTMTEGSFIGWRKSVGERIERGEVIAEVETDKAVMELEAFASGVLLKTFMSSAWTDYVLLVKQPDGKQSRSRKALQEVDGQLRLDRRLRL